LMAALDARLSSGQIVTVEIGQPEHSWMKWAGSWQGDESYDDFVAEVERYRYASRRRAAS
jgi:hypothetical protein